MCEEIEILKIIAMAICVFGIAGVLFMTVRDCINSPDSKE